MVPTLPMMFGLAVVAKPLVLVLFGAKWLPCVPYLSVLSITGALWPVHVMNLDVYGYGRSDLFAAGDSEEGSHRNWHCRYLQNQRMAMVWAMLIVGWFV